MGAIATPPPPLATLLSLGYNILQIMDQGMYQQSATPIGLAVLGLSNLRMKSKITLMQRPYNDNFKLLSCLTCMFVLLFLFHSPCCLSFLPLSFLQFSSDFSSFLKALHSFLKAYIFFSLLTFTFHLHLRKFYIQ